VNEGRRTLGVRLDPQGTDKTEYQYRLNQAQEIRQRMQRAPTNREETRIGYNAVTRPQIEYSLPATCFTKRQCDNIQSKFCPTSLSKMGINRNMPKAVVSGPTRYGGLDIRELWTIQGGGHNKATVSSLRKEDLVGEALRTEMAALQLQAGVSWPVLSRNGEHVRKYIPECHAPTPGHSMTSTN